ncbi:hypothetical protein BVC80_8553g8 [Macleaya cordata]|uniref:Uncharacterized protein n=1 Tax=Macleaya cordata TaxID=56857 RepID=A0A200QVA7_MACCD|nr:hypothetical protein BVC80_8553g8 [Macleaya cordata]
MEGTVSQSIQAMNQDFTKIERFDREDFTRWQEKMMFFLTTLQLSYILGENLEPILDETPEDSTEVKMDRMKRKEEEFLCRRHILNALSSTIYTAHRHI